MAELPSLVYYRADGGVAVNLYTSSQASLLVDGAKVEIRQETDYPASGRVVITIDPAEPAQFPLRLRIPRWCRAALPAA